MFSSFTQYEWSSDAKGVADQLKGVLHVIVDIERGITSSSSSTSLFSLIFFKQGLPEVLHAFFSLTSSPKFKVGTEFASKVLPTKWMVQTLLLSDGFHSV